MNNNNNDNYNLLNGNIIDKLEKTKVLYLFPPLLDKNYNKLMINNEGVYSITPFKCADIISKIIKKKFKTDKITIIDSTANVGGNTISFLKYFNKVISIEKNYKNFLMLQNNIKVYKLQNKVILFNGDCLDLIPKIHKKNKIDVVFIDPPWGGKSYKKYKLLNLYLSNINIIEIVKKLLYNYTKTVVIKIPYNFNFIEFFNKLDYIQFTIHKIHFKYYILICDNKIL
tara:strand:+ start:429 stop:1109 length:681 start_codon:yes stop_codon:yes gene_type:complete